MFENPFSIDRAEHLGDDLYKFYAKHKNFDDLLQRKSLILTGGRGSGKTMFFLYNTYNTRKKETLNNGLSFVEFLKKEKIIAIHLRADTGFVTGFLHKGLDELVWIDLFNHYLNLTISKEICEIVIDIKENHDTFIPKFESETCNLFKTLLGRTDQINSYNELYKILIDEEAKLIRFINNVSVYDKPITSSAGYLFNILVKSLIKEDILINKTFHVFIDEYENLLLYQQKLINTLIKHPNPTVIDIGMRKEGLKTNETLAPNEVINFPHDFNEFDIESLSSEDYEKLILESCKKRFRSIPELKDLPDESDYLNIKYYLGNYKTSDEVNFIAPDKDASLHIKQKISDILKKSIYDHDKFNSIFNGLTNTNDLILLRIQISLLLRKNNRPEELVEEFIKYQNGIASKYNDWYHNNKNGVLFLLARDFRKKKQYFGFDTYRLLSSGIIRYILEFCETAFKLASRNGFSFSNPRPLSIEEQTAAVSSVSEYKISDIDTYTPYSSRLKQFTILLGQIFETIHRDQKLSEPERNHFATDYDRLSENSKAFLKNALLWSVLQKRTETKDKNEIVSSNQYEYHLNHVYAPYFQISYRKQRKLDINYKDLDILINGTYEKAKEVVKKIAKAHSDESFDPTAGTQLDLLDNWIANDND